MSASLLQPPSESHTTGICLVILAIITSVNLRGVREASIFFMVPTYSFLGSLLVAIVIGISKFALASGHPVLVVAPPNLAGTAAASASLWLLLQVFSNGCTAMPGYQSVLSMLVAAVTGRGWFYYFAIGSVLFILSLSANTAFADFTRLCKAVAQNGYLPRSFGFRGRRLVYSQGIFVLAVLSAILLVMFRGVTDNLIPLFAIGAFLAFTLSQAGMVGHWRRVGGPGARHSILINGLGAFATGVTLVVVLVAKFRSGAWVSVLLIAGMMATMLWVSRHYEQVAQETELTAPLNVESLGAPIVIVPIQAWTTISQRALQFALTLSPEVHALHVGMEEETTELRDDWKQLVQDPVAKAGGTPPSLVTLPSPYRLVLKPILEHVLQTEEHNPGRQIAVVVPELVERHWYHYPLHNQRAEMLKAFLLIKCSRNIVLINVPWYIRA